MRGARVVTLLAAAEVPRQSCLHLCLARSADVHDFLYAPTIFDPATSECLAHQPEQLLSVFVLRQPAG